MWLILNNLNKIKISIGSGACQTSKKRNQWNLAAIVNQLKNVNFINPPRTHHFLSNVMQRLFTQA
jgi:hypothetical protein